MKSFAHSQQGVFLLEALIGILVFSLGVLAMVALGTVAVSAQSDAQYRTEVASLANEIASRIALRADRKPYATPEETLTKLNASLLPFQHNIGAATCPFPNDPSAEAVVTDWVDKVVGDAAASPPVPGLLPGATASSLQIDTTTLKAFSGVRVTLCWKGPADKANRSYTLVTYVN